MKSIPREDLLWELTGVAVDPGGAAPSDDELRAYRSGRLSAIEQERIEWLLARSSQARARLVDLSGARIARPAEPIRCRVLEGENKRGALAAAVRAAAAVLLPAAVLSTVALFWMRGAPPEVVTLPAHVQFDLRVEGLAHSRAEAGSAHALPQTAVRVVIEPRGEAVPGLAFALFRREGDRLRRLEPGREAALEASRGGAVLTATAERLVGPAPGTREFFVLVSRGGEPPHELVLEPGQEPGELLRAAGGGRAYPRALTILPTVPD